MLNASRAGALNCDEFIFAERLHEFEDAVAILVGIILQNRDAYLHESLTRAYT